MAVITELHTLKDEHLNRTSEKSLYHMKLLLIA